MWKQRHVPLKISIVFSLSFFLTLFQLCWSDNFQSLHNLLKDSQLSDELKELQRLTASFNQNRNTDRTKGRHQPKATESQHATQVEVSAYHALTTDRHKVPISESNAIAYTRNRPPNPYPWTTLQSVSHRTPVSKEESYTDLKTSPVLKVSSTPSRTFPTFVNNSHTGSHSKEFYKVMYGTKEGVAHLKSNYGPNQLSQAKVNHGVTKDLEDVKLANEHFLRMRSQGRCKVPRPELVHVKDFYPDPGKEYLPRCTSLHRCGERSGCCDSDDLKCAPKLVQEVALNFYTIHLGMHQSEVALENSVEKLLFVNHTECECVPVNDVSKYDNKIELKEPPLQDADLNPYHHNHSHSDEDENEQFNGISKCRECPFPFCKREFPDGRCSCDCFDRQKPCLRVKRGREPLPETDRRCVESGKCNIPDCEYGPYDMTTARCPKKLQKNGNSNYPPHRSIHNPNHRWSHFERD